MPRLDRYQDPALYDVLAGRYVLGTLGGRARLRLEQLIAERPYLEQAVVDWQRRLDPLAQRIPAVAPHPRVWRRIRREIRSASGPRTWAWDNLLIWRSVAFALMLFVGALAVYRATLPPPAAEPPAVAYLAVLVDKEQEPALVATARENPDRMTILMTNKPSLPPDKDYELWAIPKSEGAAPNSLGLLSGGQEGLIELSKDQLQVIARTGALAVSLEPRGGSPTGAPTGPVVLQGKLIRM